MMQLPKSLLVPTILLTLPVAMARPMMNIFSMSAVVRSNAATNAVDVSLLVWNGLSTNGPVCSGTGSAASGAINCNPGYSTTYQWGGVGGLFDATYTEPTAQPFMYNVPLTGCMSTTDGGMECHYAYSDFFNP